MMGKIGCVVGAMAALVAAPAIAETLVEHSAEFRFQLDFHVPDAALAKMLPEGWQPDIAAQGPAKDANLRLIFIDRSDVTGPDGKPVGKGSERLAYLAIPVKQATTGVGGQMIIGGLTADAANVPGPYGVYLAATSHQMERRLTEAADGRIEGEESWDFAAASGEHLAVHIAYERGTARKINAETKFFSGADPAKVQLVKIDQGLDILKNVSVPVPDRVKSFSYTATGGRYAPLFDGTERVLSWDSFHWHNRTVAVP